MQPVKLQKAIESHRVMMQEKHLNDLRKMTALHNLKIMQNINLISFYFLNAFSSNIISWIPSVHVGITISRINNLRYILRCLR